MVPTNASLLSLPPSRRGLLQQMQHLNFGRFEGLVIRDGQPVLEPPPTKVLEIKIGGENGPRPEIAAGDFLLKQQVVELFAFLDRLQNGVIDVLEVKHGLPFHMEMREDAA
ncbi:MAG: hypothetical protein AB7L90_22880 [Hyphomicrobiaceae bacterium]